VTPVREERITSADDPRLDGYRSLADPARRSDGVFVAESPEVVRRLLEARRHRLRSVLLTEASLHGLRDALAIVEPPPTVFVAAVALLREVTGFSFHRGCLALAERGPEPTPDAVLAAIAPGPATVLVVDDVSNPDNVGALFRNAAAFGVHAVLLTQASSDPLYRKTIRVSMGESLSVPWARCAAWPDTAARLHAHEFSIVTLTPDGEDLERFAGRAPARLALVIGAEGTGVSAAARGASDAATGIAMRPGFDSLNVAVATAIALYRLTRGA
jgi:tRNA G18 (ribose-2'-O)-methylase SpoU